MKDKYSDLEEMECKVYILHKCIADLIRLVYFVVIVMNALNMDYLPNDCFDIVIDKGNQI